MEIENPSPQRLRDDLQHLKDWMAKEAHLPKIDDDEWLTTFLYQCKFSLEKTKFKLDGYFSFRNKYPQVLKNRNPTAPEIVQAGQAFNISVSNRLTKDGCRVIFFKPHPDPSIFHIDHYVKRMFMIFDALYLEKDRHVNYITVTDCQPLHFQHFLKGLPGITVGANIFNNAYSERVKIMTAINAPPFIGKVIDAFKLCLSKKLGDRMFVHETVSDLLKIVDENVVCKEFGGKGPSLVEYDEYTKRILAKHEKWFVEQDDLCTNELLRKKDKRQLEEMKGSFRKLEVD